MAETVERTFSTPEGCDLTVKNVSGTVSVEGWERPETEVVATKHVDWAEVQIQQEGRQVIVRTKDERGANGFLDWLVRHRTPKVDLAVHVPYVSNIEVTNVNGVIEISRIQGSATTHNVDGPTRVEDVSGSVRAETVNGPIEAAQLEGEARLKAVNGRLALLGSRVHSLAAEAVNGEIEVQTAIEGGGCYTFNTVNGSCHLTVAADTSAHLLVHGVNLGVDCSLPTRSLERSFGKWEATIGDAVVGRAEISFHTVNGRLRLDSGEPGPTQAVPFAAKAPEQPSVPPQPPEPPKTGFVAKVADAPSGTPVPGQGISKKQVLEMLEAGQITVEEALGRLRNL